MMGFSSIYFPEFQVPSKVPSVFCPAFGAEWSFLVGIPGPDPIDVGAVENVQNDELSEVVDLKVHLANPCRILWLKYHPQKWCLIKVIGFP